MTAPPPAAAPDLLADAVDAILDALARGDRGLADAVADAVAGAPDTFAAFAEGQPGTNPPFPGAVYNPATHHYEKPDGGGRAVLALGEKGMRVFHAVEHRLLYAMKKTEELAAAAARERGLPEEKVDRLRKALYAADFVGGYATGAGAVALGLPIWAVKASMVGPSLSVLYLAYSTARNPKATLRAAKKVVKETLAKGQPAAHSELFAEGADPLASLAGAIADRLAGGVDGEWFLAVLTAALAETGDPAKALELTDRALAEVPRGPEEDDSEEPPEVETDEVPSADAAGD